MVFRRLGHVLAVIAFACSWAFVLDAPADAQVYGAAAPAGAALSRTTLVPGERFTVSCASPPCADSGADVRVGIMTSLIVLGHLTADANGDYSGSFRVPARIEPGSHSVVVDTALNGAPIRYTTAVKVLPITPALGAPNLPRTGEHIARFGFIGLVLFAIGVPLAAVRRIRMGVRGPTKSHSPQRPPARVHSGHR